MSPGETRNPSNPIFDIYYIRYPYPFRFGSYHAILRALSIAFLVKRLYKDSRLSQQTYQRLLRTRHLIRALIYFGQQSTEAAQAIDSINQAHANVDAANDDYLYVLSTFFLEPLRWNRAYGHSEISNEDLDHVVNFWCQIGCRMGIEDLPSDIEQWWKFQAEYENLHMAYSQQGQELATRSIVELCKQAIPPLLRPVARQILYASMDAKVRDCLKLPEPLIPAKPLMRLLYMLKPGFEPDQPFVDSKVTQISVAKN